MNDVTCPIIGMIHNAKLERWHPILFLYSPTPSGMSRHKSKGHHTAGFISRDEAVISAQNELAVHVEERFGKPELYLEKDFPWDGDDVPAMVIFFGKADGKVVPMF